jgi:branched-chain amino acid transport system ATP-binding protein
VFDANTPALELRDVVQTYGNTTVLHGVNLQVQRGERVAVIGPNGAGKSTLFNVISGRHRASCGTVLLQGQAVQGKKPYEINRLGLARSFQVSSLFPTLSVFDNLRCSVLWRLGYRYSLWQRLTKVKDANEQTHALLQELQLTHKAQVRAMDLSYSEQRALELGMTFATGAHTVLLDEPTAGMSQSETQYFVGLVRRLSEGKTLLMVEHDMGVVFELADRVAVLVQGQVIAFDTPQAVRANVAVQTAYLGTDAVGGGDAASY